MQLFKAKVCRLYSLEYRSRGRQQGVVLGVRDCLADPPYPRGQFPALASLTLPV